MRKDSLFPLYYFLHNSNPLYYFLSKYPQPLLINVFVIALHKTPRVELFLPKIQV